MLCYAVNMPFLLLCPTTGEVTLRWWLKHNFENIMITNY